MKVIYKEKWNQKRHQENNGLVDIREVSFWRNYGEIARGGNGEYWLVTVSVILGDILRRQHIHTHARVHARKCPCRRLSLDVFNGNINLFSRGLFIASSRIITPSPSFHDYRNACVRRLSDTVDI